MRTTDKAFEFQFRQAGLLCIRPPQHEHPKLQGTSEGVPMLLNKVGVSKEGGSISTCRAPSKCVHQCPCGAFGCCHCAMNSGCKQRNAGREALGLPKPGKTDNPKAKQGVWTKCSDPPDYGLCLHMRWVQETLVCSGPRLGIRAQEFPKRSMSTLLTFSNLQQLTNCT